MNQGYIKLHRQLLDNPIWYLEPFTYGQAWADLILLANHKDNEINVRGNIIKIPRGSVGISQENLATRWKWSRGKVNRFLNFLEKKSENIIQQKSFTISLIHLKNYNRFQSSDTADSTADGQQTVQQTDINNNDNNNINSNELIKETKVSRKKTEKEKEESRKIYEQNEQIRKFLLQTIGISDFTETQKMQRIYLNHIRNWANKEIQRLQEELGEQGRAEFQKLFLKRLDFLIKDSFKSKRVNSIAFIYSEIKAFNDSLLDNNNDSSIKAF